MKRVAVALLLACDAAPSEAPPSTPAPVRIEPPKPAPPKPAPPKPAPPKPEQRTPPNGWIDLRVAIPDGVFAIGYATSDNFTGAPLPGYGAPGAWLRDDAAAALQRASASLAKEDRKS